MELHLSILDGIQDRYTTPYFDNLQKYALRPIGTYLYGRRLYETMVVWETLDTSADDESPVMRDYANVWRSADKIVYSSTLADVSSARTRLERRFDPTEVELA